MKKIVKENKSLLTRLKTFFNKRKIKQLEVRKVFLTC